jgi:hypothetical protein
LFVSFVAKCWPLKLLKLKFCGDNKCYQFEIFDREQILI